MVVGCFFFCFKKVEMRVKDKVSSKSHTFSTVFVAFSIGWRMLNALTINFYVWEHLLFALLLVMDHSMLSFKILLLPSLLEKKHCFTVHLQQNFECIHWGHLLKITVMCRVVYRHPNILVGLKTEALSKSQNCWKVRPNLFLVYKCFFSQCIFSYQIANALFLANSH